MSRHDRLVWPSAGWSCLWVLAICASCARETPRNGGPVPEVRADTVTISNVTAWSGPPQESGSRAMETVPFGAPWWISGEIQGAESLEGALVSVSLVMKPPKYPEGVHIQQKAARVVRKEDGSHSFVEQMDPIPTDLAVRKPVLRAVYTFAGESVTSETPITIK